MKKIILFTSTLFLLFSFSGCSSKTLSVAQMQKEIGTYKLPRSAPADKATVYIVRPTSLGGFVRFNVFVDSKEDTAEVGYTRANQYINFDLTPGIHTIYSKAENWAEIEVNATKNQTIFIEQIPSMGILFARNKLSTLEEVKGTYQMKDLKLGTIHEKK